LTRPSRITANKLKQVRLLTQEISLNLTAHQSGRPPGVLIKENACHLKRYGNWHDTRAQLVA
jgi:hypothetical protein